MAARSVLAVMALISVWTPVEGQYKLFTQYRMTTDDTARDTLATVVSDSVLTCASLCKTTEHCVAVNFKMATTECVMLKTGKGSVDTVNIPVTRPTNVTTQQNVTTGNVTALQDVTTLQDVTANEDVDVVFTPVCDAGFVHVSVLGTAGLPIFQHQCIEPCAGGDNVVCEVTCSTGKAWEETCVVPTYPSCKAAFDAGQRRNGIYTIKPDASAAFDVVCDMDVTTENYDLGGWTVIFNSDNTDVPFSGKFAAQKELMGDLDADFFIGLRKLHRITLSQTSMATVDIIPYYSEWPKANYKRYARYMTFEVGAENTNFRLTSHSYQGNAGDGFSEVNGRTWTATDYDTDSYGGNCADYNQCQGGWFVTCSYYCFMGRKKGQLAGYVPMRYGHNFWYPTNWYWALKKMRIKLR